jgi:cell division septum initiation protein DivIVA
LAEAIFKKSFKGYDTAQVDEFIITMSDRYGNNEKEMTDRIRAAESENERLRDEINRLRAEADERERNHENELIEKQKEYDALCAEIGEKMVVADKRAAEIIKNAEKEAALILTDARRNSENEVKAIRTRAEDEAARMIEDTRRRCETLSAAAEEFRARQNEMNQSMIETENRFASALNRLREGIGGEE